MNSSLATDTHSNILTVLHAKRLSTPGDMKKKKIVCCSKITKVISSSIAEMLKKRIMCSYKLKAFTLTFKGRKCLDQ